MWSAPADARLHALKSRPSPSRRPELRAMCESIQQAVGANLQKFMERLVAEKAVAPGVDLELVPHLIMVFVHALFRDVALQPNHNIDRDLDIMFATIRAALAGHIKLTNDNQSGDTMRNTTVRRRSSSPQYLQSHCHLPSPWAKRQRPPQSSNTAKKAALAAPSISVLVAQKGKIAENLNVTGSFAAGELVLVTPEVEGFAVTDLLAEEGDTVKKGQVLARLSSLQVEIQIAQTKASLARNDAAVAQAQNQIEQAQITEERAGADLARTAKLRTSGVSSVEQFDQRQS